MTPCDQVEKENAVGYSYDGNNNETEQEKWPKRKKSIKGSSCIFNTLSTSSLNWPSYTIGTTLKKKVF